MTGADPRFADFEGLRVLLMGITWTDSDDDVEVVDVEVVDGELVYGVEYIFQPL